MSSPSKHSMNCTASKELARASIAIALLSALACGENSPPYVEKATVLATGRRAGPIMLDANNIYWAENGYGDAERGLYQMAKSGGPIVTLASLSGDIRSFGVDATCVYFPSNGTIEAVPIGGGTSRVLATNTVATGVAVENGNVYWSDGTVDSQGHVSIEAVSAGGGATTLLPVTREAPAGPAEWVMADSDAVYAIFDSGIARVTLSTNAADWINVQKPYALATDESTLYLGSTDVGAATTRLQAISKTTGAAVDLIAKSTDFGNFTVDDQYLYFTTLDTPSQIRKMAKTGGSSDLLDDQQRNVFYVAVDAADIYWIDNFDGSIKKLAK